MEVGFDLDINFIEAFTESKFSRFPFRPNHSQQSDLYKPSRSPLANASRYPYPVSPQLQQTSVSQVVPNPQPPVQQQPQPQPQQQVQQQRYNVSVSVPPVPSSYPPAPGYRDYRQPRISLLHPEYGRPREQQLQGAHPGAVPASGGGAGQQVHHLDGGAAGYQGCSGGQQPFKKMRLQDQKDMQPLRIDTRVGFSGS